MFYWISSFMQLPAYSRHMRPNIVVHEEEPRTHCISEGSDSWLKDFTLNPTAVRIRLPSLLRSAGPSMDMPLPDRHCPTTKLLVPNDATGSIMLTTASLDSFFSLMCAQGEPAVFRPASFPILWQILAPKCRAVNTGPPRGYRRH